jgi:UDP-glucose 4-epimerase
VSDPVSAAQRPRAVGGAGGRILITGAGGFIGSHLARRLLDDNGRVHAWTRGPGIPWRLRDLGGGLTVDRVDITDRAAVAAAMRRLRPARIFHLAAFTNPDRAAAQNEPALEVNIRGTLHVLAAALDTASAEVIVNTGTCEEYGTARAPFTEDTREAPVSPYSASKVAATHLAAMFHRTFGLPVVTLRPFLTYGPAQDRRMLIPSLIVHCLERRDFAMTEGTQLRELNYVGDVVDAFVRAADRRAAVGEIINVGTGEPRALIATAERIVERMGRPIALLRGAHPPRFGESDIYCDNTKARRLLGWRPAVDFDEGLDRTIAWYRLNDAPRHRSGGAARGTSRLTR